MPFYIDEMCIDIRATETSIKTVWFDGEITWESCNKYSYHREWGKIKDV